MKGVLCYSKLIQNVGSEDVPDTSLDEIRNALVTDNCRDDTIWREPSRETNMHLTY